MSETGGPSEADIRPSNENQSNVEIQSRVKLIERMKQAGMRDDEREFVYFLPGGLCNLVTETFLASGRYDNEEYSDLKCVMKYLQKQDVVTQGDQWAIAFVPEQPKNPHEAYSSAKAQTDLIVRASVSPNCDLKEIGGRVIISSRKPKK